MGLFITFEGVEGCGKTTQARMLYEHLAGHGVHTLLTREPGGCPIADAIRAILLDAENRELVPTAELLLYAAARAQHVSQVIRPALTGGSVVICDRFTDATIAYQGSGRGLDHSLIERLNDIASPDLRPDLTILIDIPVNTGLSRAFSRMAGSAAPREERFEQESVEFHERVREGYLMLARREPGRFMIVDGDRPIPVIHQEIRERLANLLPPRDAQGGSES
jgi:dTMP kinase